MLAVATYMLAQAGKLRADNADEVQASLRGMVTNVMGLKPDALEVSVDPVAKMKQEMPMMYIWVNLGNPLEVPGLRVNCYQTGQLSPFNWVRHRDLKDAA